MPRLCNKLWLKMTIKFDNTLSSAIYQFQADGKAY